jgi:hypothetical protein
VKLAPSGMRLGRVIRVVLAVALAWGIVLAVSRSGGYDSVNGCKDPAARTRRLAELTMPRGLTPPIARDDC